MKIKVQIRKLAAGCSKYSFKVVDRTDEVSNHTYGKATLTRFEEIFEETYPSIYSFKACPFSPALRAMRSFKRAFWALSSLTKKTPDFCNCTPPPW